MKAKNWSVVKDSFDVSHILFSCTGPGFSLTGDKFINPNTG
jgi:hypothetical protein